MAGLQSVADGTNRWLESLVHPALHREPDVLYRARVLVALVLFINGVVALSCFIMAITFVSVQTRATSTVICLALIVSNFLLLYVLRSRGNFVVCSLAAAVLVGTGIVFGIMVSGGIVQSSTTQLLVLPSLMMYFFAGRRWGTYSVLLILAVMVLLFVAQGMELLVPARIELGDKDLSRMMQDFLGVMAVSAMALIFERTASKLKRERDAEHQKLLLLAQTDALTGLANRRSFDVQLNERIGAAPRQFALCFIDLDGFKAINDRYGHAVGDEVLCIVAQRLRQSARDHDVVGRQGGDEFTLIFDALTSADALPMTMERMLSSISRPIDTSAGPLSLAASIGVALYPQHAASAETLKKAADQAMYVAKQKRNQWCLHDTASAG